MHCDDAIRISEHSVAELTIQDVVQKSDRMPFPVDTLLIQFNSIAKDVMKKMSGSRDSH